jgi:tetratricopeptide (TPR) repeat protein
MGSASQLSGLAPAAAAWEHRRATMTRLIVQFPDDAAVVVDGAAAGRTNRVIALAEGEHVVSLDADSEPAERTVAAPAGDEVVHVAFTLPRQSVDRFSPLYCAYNGFLLGQFISLSFAGYGRAGYPVRRARMLEFMAEAGIAADLPEEPSGLGSPEHERLLEQVLPQAKARAEPLGDFTLLGTLLTHYGVLAESDPDTARDSLDLIESIRSEHGLPPIEPSRFVVGQEDRHVDDVLSPSLAYLAEIVDGVDVEPDTAFVVMPFSPPYAEYFSTFYRSSLEKAGLRAFRAWGGLSSEDYGVLLLKLISKSGFAWADVSEPNANVFYEVGAAHAFGKLAMIVTREDRAHQTPANIGHDAVVRYSDTDAGWPESTSDLMAALIAGLRTAAEAGERVRVTSDALVTVLEDVGRQLAARITPPEAQEAADDGHAKLAAGDAEGAARAFDEAIGLGLDDAHTWLGRGLSRMSLERYDDAEADLGAALADPGGGAELHQLAAQFRGAVRELKEDSDGALADYRLAIELGSASPDVFLGSARVEVTCGDLDAARAAIDRAREAGADPAAVAGAEGDVLSAEGRFDEAVAAYDRSLAQAENATVEFDRALALLLGGHAAEAIAGYRRGAATADADDRRYALAALDRRAAGNVAAEACRQALADESS